MQSGSANWRAGLISAKREGQTSNRGTSRRRQNDPQTISPVRCQHSRSNDDDSQTTSSGENASLVYGHIYGTRYIWDLAGMELEVMLGRTVNAKRVEQPTAAVWEE